MAKAKKSTKPPSRKRYDEEHPTVSFRLDKQTHRRLKEHLEETNCSPADFIKDGLGRDQPMTERRVEELAAKQMGPSRDDSLRCLQDLIHQLLSVALITSEYTPLCPRCDHQDLLMCEGKETKATTTLRWAITWKCPKCGFFVDTYERIDPKSIKWVEFNSSKSADKPKTPNRHRPKKH